ncbi:MAG: tyrosine-type recombinase/integrase [Christensenellales bacterium]
MSYFTDRNNSNIIKTRELMRELPDFCAEFLTGIANGTTPLTRLNYARDLKLFFYFLTTEIRTFRNITVEEFDYAALEKVTATDIEMFLDYLNYYVYEGTEHQNNERGKYRKLSTIRSLFKYLYNKDRIHTNVASKVSLPKLHEKEIIRLDKSEISDVIREAEYGDKLTRHQQAFHEKTKARDVAILTLFLGTGIRISECVGLDVDDVNFKDNSFTVTRKGGNRTILYFTDEVADALKWYLETRNCNPAVPAGEKALFLSMSNKRISVRAVQMLVKKYSRLISPLKKISPHKLRSSFGTELYRKTKDIYVVAEVLGHKDINTTKKHYAALSEDIKRNAIKNISLSEDQGDE